MILVLNEKNCVVGIDRIKFKDEKLDLLMKEALKSAMNTFLFKTLPAYINKSVFEALKKEIELIDFKGEYFEIARDGPYIKLVKKNK